MKKLSKISSLMFTLATIANNSFATTSNVANSTKMLESSSGSEYKVIGTLALGALLICCVLFIGYKMDSASENPTVKVNKRMKDKSQRKNNIEKEETEFYKNEINKDEPYEVEENDYFENDSNNDFTILNEEQEYEEDDISLFSQTENFKSSFDNFDDDISFEKESQFENIDDNISFEKESQFENIDDDISFEKESQFENIDDNISFEKEFFSEEVNTENSFEEKSELQDMKEDLDSTMIFDTSELTNEIEEDDDLEYSDAVEWLDEKIDSLDKFEEYEGLKEESSAVNDTESFFEEIKRNETEFAEDFEGFTTKDLNSKKKKPTKKYTKKKDLISELMDTEQSLFDNQNDTEFVKVSEPGVLAEFLSQMEENLMHNQKEKVKKTTKKSKKTEEKTVKKETKKKSTKKKE